MKARILALAVALALAGLTGCSNSENDKYEAGPHPVVEQKEEEEQIQGFCATTTRAEAEAHGANALETWIAACE